MKKIYLLLMFFIPFTGLKAQENMTPKQKITEVLQLEESFLYADQTCTTLEQALERAQAILLREVDAYLKESGENGEEVKGTVTEQMVTITVQRGDKYRAFVYVNKADIGAEPQETQAEEKTVTIKEHPVVGQPAEQETDTIQAVETDDMKQEKDILGKIAAMTSRLQVYDYICQLQKEGRKISFYEHPNADEQADMYLILYKRGGKIEAILTPTDEQGIRHNLATSQPDTKNNHPATSVNGFIYER